MDRDFKAFLETASDKVLKEYDKELARKIKEAKSLIAECQVKRGLIEFELNFKR